MEAYITEFVLTESGLEEVENIRFEELIVNLLGDKLSSFSENGLKATNPLKSTISSLIAENIESPLVGSMS